MGAFVIEFQDEIGAIDLKQAFDGPKFILRESLMRMMTLAAKMSSARFSVIRFQNKSMILENGMTRNFKPVKIKKINSILEL